MDPDANLREQREVTARLLADLDGRGAYGGAQDQLADVGRLAELSQAMDGWLSRGGAYPSAWPCQPSAEAEAER
jgi:hypothetical protein